MGDSDLRLGYGPVVPAPATGRGVLEGAFALIEAVQRAEEAGLTALASTSGLPKATTYRLLEQLVALGALERSGVRYRMGPRIFRLGQGWQPLQGLRMAARAPTRHLARTTGATVGLCVLREGRTLAIGGILGEAHELVSFQPGVTWPWETAAGKVIVAHAPSHPPPDPAPDSWPAEAEDIRRRGVAFDSESLVPGVCCVAVPLCGPRGEAVAGLCAIVDPARSLEHLTGELLRTGRVIAARLRGR